LPATAQFGEAIQDAAGLFGLGADSGLPLPNERAGFVPTPELKAQRHEEHPEAFPEGRWFAGDNVNIAIGQGDMLVTPLQLANAYSVLANGGTLYSPNIVARIQRGGSDEVVRQIDPRVTRQVPLPPEIRQPIIDGLTGVTQNERGTAYASFLGFPNWAVAGKTGTAEVAGKADTAVFVGMAPAEAPQYVVTAFLEESGFGGVAAAPLVRRVLEPLADPARMPEVGPGGVLSFPLAPGTDPLANGDITD
jgi:penicillin-binding protein 2